MPSANSVGTGVWIDEWDDTEKRFARPHGRIERSYVEMHHLLLDHVVVLHFPIF